jgi:D-alanyl-D-alanine carboxypeptidase
MKCLWLISLIPSFSFAPFYSAVVMDPHRASIIDGVRCHKIIYPASLTKLMTLYILFEGLSQKEITMNTMLSVSKHASRQPPSKFWIKTGQKISVRACILALAARSANDVAVAVAENLSPSFSAFIDRMNKTARKLHMNHTHFCNPSGWHHPNHRSTVYDLALLMRALWKNFPHYSAFLGITAFKYNKKIYHNTNKLQGKVQGIQMGKTGYTSHAGWNLATLVERHNKPLIIVIVGMPSNSQRNHHMARVIHAFYAQRHQAHHILWSPLAQKKHKSIK